MALYDTEEAVNKAMKDNDPGYLFIDKVPAEKQIQMHFFGPPVPRWRYFQSEDGRLFCWNSQPLPDDWYRPFRWMFWIMTSDGDVWERDPDSIRFADLRREAKEEAYARCRAAESELT